MRGIRLLIPPGRPRFVAEFQLTAAEQQFAGQVRETARQHLVSLAGQTGGRVNRPLLAALGKLGLLRGLFGGQPDEPARDAAALQLCLLRESLAQVSGEAETALAVQGLGSYPILQSGPPALAGRWIPELISGQAVAAFALSEPEPARTRPRSRCAPIGTARAGG